jgi:hypothetical protein
VTVVTIGVLLRFTKLKEPLVVLAAAAAGLLLHPLVRP